MTDHDRLLDTLSFHPLSMTKNPLATISTATKSPSKMELSLPSHLRLKQLRFDPYLYNWAHHAARTTLKSRTELPSKDFLHYIDCQKHAKEHTDWKGETHIQRAGDTVILEPAMRSAAFALFGFDLWSDGERARNAFEIDNTITDRGLGCLLDSLLGSRAPGPVFDMYPGLQTRFKITGVEWKIDDVISEDFWSRLLAFALSARQFLWPEGRGKQKSVVVDDKTSLERTTKDTEWSTSSPLSPIPSVNIWPQEGQRSGRSRPQRDIGAMPNYGEDNSEAEPASGLPGHHASISRKRRLREPDEEQDDGNAPRAERKPKVSQAEHNAAAYEEGADRKFTYVLTQVWTQMVKADLTFACLSTYNRSVLLRRHRQSRTLFISHRIDGALTSEETKLLPFMPLAMTGLVILGYRDLLNRVGLSNVHPLTSSSGSEKGDDSKHSHEHKPSTDNSKNDGEGDGGNEDKGKGEGSDSLIPIGGSDGSRSTQNNLNARVALAAQRLSASPTLGVFYRGAGRWSETAQVLYPVRLPEISRKPKHRNTRSARVPGRFRSSSEPSLVDPIPDIAKYRVALSSSPMQSPRPHPLKAKLLPKDDLDLMLVEPLGEGRCGHAWKGYLLCNAEKLMPVVGKVAGTDYKDSEPSDLRREARIYSLLSRMDGIPRFLGLYGDEYMETLVLSYAGRQVENMALIDVEARRTALRTVQRLHEKNVLHGDPRIQNLAYNRESGQLTVIDFDQAEYFSHGLPEALAIEENKAFQTLLLLT